MNCKHGIPDGMCVACRINADNLREARKIAEEEHGMCTNASCQQMRDHTESLRIQFNKVILFLECLVKRGGGRLTIVLKDEVDDTKDLTIEEHVEKRGPVIRLRLVPKDKGGSDVRETRSVDESESG